MIRLQGVWVLAILTMATPLRAAEVDKYLPPDTEVVISINVRQILSSELLKKAGLEQWKQMLKNAGPINDALQDLGFDPFKDLDRVTVATPGGSEQDRGLIILRGNFDPAKIKAKVDNEIKTNADALKVHKVPDGLGGQSIIYETVIPDQKVPLFVAIASKDTILLSPGKDYVVDGLKKVAAKESAGLRNKDMHGLLEKMDDKQSLSLAALGSALAKSGNLPDNAKDAIEKLDAVGGGVTATDEVKLEIALSTKSPEAAKEIDKTLSDGLNQAVGLVALFASQKKELAPAIDILKTVRCASKGKVVIIKAQVPADIIDKALGKD